jgi:hypothetical protein
MDRPGKNNSGHDDGLARGRMSAWRDLGFYQVLEPVEVGGDALLKPAAQQAGGQPERAAGRGPDRLGEERHGSLRRQAVLLLEADRPGDAGPARRPGGSYPVTSYDERTVAGPARAVIV